MDCMEGMAQFPDKFFDLAVVDPPYGGAGQDFKRSDKSRFGGKFDKYKRDNPIDSGGGYSVERRGGTWASKYGKKIIGWDHAPGEEYFKELFRVSKNQIIWGGNYFSLPPTRCFVCWDKMQPWPNFSQAEFAWTSFSNPSKMFRFDNRTGGKIHPTQKPVELYAFLLQQFAPTGGG